MAGEPVEEKYRKAFENLLEVVASKTSCSNGECIYEQRPGICQFVHGPWCCLRVLVGCSRGHMNWVTVNSRTCGDQSESVCLLRHTQSVSSHSSCKPLTGFTDKGISTNHRPVCAANVPICDKLTQRLLCSSILLEYRKNSHAMVYLKSIVVLQLFMHALAPLFHGPKLTVTLLLGTLRTVETCS